MLRIADLPPLVEAPPCIDEDQDPSRSAERDQLRLSPREFNYTFARTITPSFFGASEDTSISALVSDAPSPSTRPIYNTLATYSSKTRLAATATAFYLSRTAAQRVYAIVA